MVLSAVNEMHRHVTADQIYTFIRDKYPSIGRGTVYRNLGILVEEGKVRKVEVRMALIALILHLRIIIMLNV